LGIAFYAIRRRSSGSSRQGVILMCCGTHCARGRIAQNSRAAHTPGDAPRAWTAHTRLGTQPLLFFITTFFPFSFSFFSSALLHFPRHSLSLHLLPLVRKLIANVIFFSLFFQRTLLSMIFAIPFAATFTVFSIFFSLKQFRRFVSRVCQRH
jgi:hypothetical protein